MRWVVFVFCVQAVAGWTKGWNFKKQFKNAGLETMNCPDTALTADCCVCQVVSLQIEKELNETKDDRDMDVVFRLSEEKKTIKYSHSQIRILEVMDDVCDRVEIEVPMMYKGKKFDHLLMDTCDVFIDEFDDMISSTFYNDPSPGMHRLCNEKLNGALVYTNK